MYISSAEGNPWGGGQSGEEKMEQEINKNTYHPAIEVSSITQAKCGYPYKQNV